MISARGWERIAGAASLGAALVHGGLTSVHFREWWGYGVFFLVGMGLVLVQGGFIHPIAQRFGEGAILRFALASNALGLLLLAPPEGGYRVRFYDLRCYYPESDAPPLSAKNIATSPRTLDRR